MATSLASSAGADRLIITGASRSYGPSLLAFLGSLTLNWPGHPQVLVYDIGLDAGTLEALQRYGISVRKVPPFCAHWRRHYTWKLWCLADAPARDVLWCDAGLVCLAPLEDVFVGIDRLGYFGISTYHDLLENASEAACAGCGLALEFRNGRITLHAGVIGLRKAGQGELLVKEALAVGMREECIAATEPGHRWDQAILSLLLHKYFAPLVIADGTIYGGWLSPRQTPAQRVWIHRRALLAADQAHFARHVSEAGPPHEPAPSRPQPTPPVRRVLRALRSWLAPAPPASAHVHDGVKD